MPRSVEEILGRGPVEQERTVPGTQVGEADKVRYVSFSSHEHPASVFRNVTRKMVPPRMTGGGVMLEGCIITLPESTSFYPLVFHGDVAGWQRQIEEGAQALGLLSAKIQGNQILLSDGRKYSLSDCNIEFD